MNDFNYRPKRCDDCGFTKGTRANTNGVTEIKAQLCAEIPEPFFCHFNAKGEDLSAGTKLTLQDGKEFLCQGWVEKCNELEAENYYESQPDFHKQIKMTLVEAIVDVEEKLQKKEITVDEASLYLDQKILELTATW